MPSELHHSEGLASWPGHTDRPLRVLITNCWLENRAGTELYVRDVAYSLLRAGHHPMAWSPITGPVAEEIQAMGVPVFDDIDKIPEPDLVHCHHRAEAIAALSRFPGRPGIYVQHAFLAWQDDTPVHPRLLRYVAVDELCRRRVLAAGIDVAKVRTIQNGVDVHAFGRRGMLPDRPKRALVFSNAASEQNYVPAIRAACESLGIELDVAGVGVGAVLTRPELDLRHYDVVFAKARAAVEAMAVGCAVVVTDASGLAGMVTSQTIAEGRAWNFGQHLLVRPNDVGLLRSEIERYNVDDAAACTDWVRANCTLEQTMDQLLTTYYDVLDEWAVGVHVDYRAEIVAASRPLATIGRLNVELSALQADLADARSEVVSLGSELDRVATDALGLRRDLDSLHNSRSIRLRNALASSRWAAPVRRLMRGVVDRALPKER
jgi:hypothetical protein